WCVDGPPRQQEKARDDLRFGERVRRKQTGSSSTCTDAASVPTSGGNFRSAFGRLGGSTGLGYRCCGKSSVRRTGWKSEVGECRLDQRGPRMEVHSCIQSRSSCRY